MKRLLLMRHAKSSWEDSSVPDHDRPLNDRGRRDAPTMGHLLVDEGLVPDLIISSTAKRAVQTAELVAAACGYDEQIIKEVLLYHAPLPQWEQTVASLPESARTVLLVGHNPGVELFQRELTGVAERFKTATLAYLTLESRWSGRKWRGVTLDSIWNPKEL